MLDGECVRKRQPLLSVVIATYNYGQFLEEAIRSVLSQKKDDNLELIVCDGGSSDNSIEIIKKYEDEISWWVSEKDGGQSAAFNKGFSHSHGRFLTWVNADDVLMPGTMKALERATSRHPECEWFTGNYLQFRQDNKKIIFAPWGPHIMPGFVQTFNAPLVVFGPTSFWSRSAYESVGPIDELLHYSMDTDYWLRMKKAGYKQRRLLHCCWAFRMHDKSKTAQYDGRKIEDGIRRKWYDELDAINCRIGYRCSRVRKFLMYIVRALDGSFAVAIWRKLFVVGRSLEFQG